MACNLITRVSSICHVKPTQRTALEQKRFDLRSLSPALRNLGYLTIIPRARMGAESIAHEAEGRMGY